MGDDSCDPLFVSCGGKDGVVEQGCFPVCHQAPVLHGSSIEIRQSNLIYREQGF